MTVEVDWFGVIRENDKSLMKVKIYKLSNRNIEVKVISYGATITSLKIPDRFGDVGDIVMGFDNLEGYIKNTYYFGCTVGRFANRIAGSKFRIGNDLYSLATNNGPNHLHGGNKGFDKVIWDSTVHNNKVMFSYTSPSMEENYPGDLKCDVVYHLTEKDELIINYKATTTQKTPVNLTNHSYFNLAGHGSGTIQDHVISLNADCYLPVDDTSIPTGVICPVSSTNFDLREPKTFGDLLQTRPSGYDHNFCINNDSAHEKRVAVVHHPKSGRVMKVFSTQPGVQLYTANFLPVDESLVGKNGSIYKKNGAFCLETQNYPDAVNQINFPNAFLDVDEVYNHTTRYLFSVQ